MKIYLAGPWEYGPELRRVRAECMRGFGSVTITSSWLDIDTGTVSANAYEAADFALHDLADVDRAEMLILFNPEGFNQSPGRNIEFGYALAKGKSLMICGKQLGVFQYLPHIHHVPDLEGLYAWWKAYWDKPYTRR